MSYDELPPDAQPPRSAEEAVTPAQDPSAQDAPPATTTRRRRAKSTGTDAASPSETPKPADDRPARPTRRRVAAATPPESPPAAAEVPEIPEGARAPETEVKPARRRRAVARPQTEADAVPPVELPSVESAPADKPRRTRRKATAEPVSPPVAEETVAPVSPPATGPDGADSDATAQNDAPTAGSKSRARRGRRSRKGSAAAAEPTVSTEEQDPESLPADLPGIVERIDAPHVIAELGGATGEIDETEGPEDGGASDVTTPSSEGQERRSRRNRRGGRSRRGEPRAEREPVVEIVEAVAELVEPAIPVVEEPPIDLSVGAHLVPIAGIPVIHIDGRPFPPVLFFGNMEGVKNTQHVLSEVRRAAQAGVHLHSTLIELPCPLSEAGHVLDELDTRLRAILDADPDGFVMPRIVFLPAKGWKREYATEISTYADGTTGDPALTSARFWQECERSLEALILHINDQIWGARVFGYHLERGEWFQTADLGYDRSMANRDAFRDWLREKYNQDLVGLRAAWYDGDAQFHTAEIPTLPTKPATNRAFYETRRERAIIDFNEFTSESTAHRLIALARVVKRATRENALVSLCYGYTFEFGHGFSGHLALNLLLAERCIDVISGPPSYRDRKAGGAASFPAPIGSFPLHGKLWLSEDDTKTYLAPAQQDPADFNPRMADPFQTEQAQIRTVGKALVHGTAVGWMDLWGEGWLDEAALWEKITDFRNYAALRARKQVDPEVVALIDEKSLLHVQKGELFFRRLTNSLHDTLQRAGVSYETYLQSDLLAPNFPTGAKLYLFLTPFRLTVDQRAAIKEKLQRDNKTLAWLYAPGACEEQPGIGSLMDESASNVVGITLRHQPWNSEVGSRVLETTSPLTERLQGRDLGARERLNPSFYVDDPNATVLAEYQGSGLPSLAVKNHTGWRSIFVGDPVLPLELLRGICRLAGVHLWSGGGEDVLDVRDGWLLLHAARDGQRTMRFPETMALYDVIERRLVSEEARDYRFFLRAGNSRLFYAGSREQMRAIGLSNVPNAEVRRIAIPEPRQEPEAPPPAPVSPRIVLPDRLETPLNSDLETLRAVLAMEIPESELENTEVEEPLNLPMARPDAAALAVLEETLSIEEPTSGGRRRRRRGGRGRGRRKPGAADAAGTGAPGAEASGAPQGAEPSEGGQDDDSDPD